ncbi:ABC transporter substrate-binding protein [Rhizomonospora bruguierae]|uniref:ABC transporter substrate-binding protein n=1 Tax=Rhizomonospora bruguierae TaxID=1581705 RepID=UPI001BCCF553|nr:ABC transporter substrate-binding protein [Micromonospora sp. NBRC 107566]
MRRRRISGLRAAAAGTVIALLAGCGSTSTGATGSDGETSTVKVVTNFGTIYYGLLLGLDLLAEEHPDLKVEHVQLSAGGDSLTALASGQADLVSVGVSPVLIAREKGLPVRFGGALVTAHIALVAMDEKYRSLADFQAGDQIATPGPYAVGSIALLGAAKRELGDWKKVNGMFRMMPHPDAVTALTQREVQAHMATPPFLQEDLAKGAHEVIGGNSLLGAPVPLGAFAFSETFHKANPKRYAALVDAIERGTAMINTDPQAAATRLAGIKAVQTTKEKILVELTEQGITFDTKFEGYTETADTMLHMGLIKKNPALSDVSFPGVTGS